MVRNLYKRNENPCINNYTKKYYVIIYKEWYKQIFILFFFLKGVTQAIQNAGLGLIALLAGVIKDADDTFVWLEIFYIAWLGLAILTTALMWVLDFRRHNYLFMSNKERKVFEKTPEYFKMMRIEMPRQSIDKGTVNEGFE